MNTPRGRAACRAVSCLGTVLLWAACCLAAPAARAEVLRLEQAGPLPIALDDHVEVLEDRSGRMPFEAVARLASGTSDGFAPGSAARMRRGFSDSVFWLRLSLANDGDAVRPLRLVLNTPWLQSVDFHVQRSGAGAVPAGPWTQAFAGVARPTPAGSAPDRVPGIALALEPGEQARVLVRVQSRSSVRLAPLLHSADSWQASESAHALLDGLLIGGLLVLAAYSLSVWAVTRSGVLASQGLGFVLVALYEASYRGYARLWLWPDSPEWSYRAAGVIAGCCLLNLVLYLHALSHGGPVRPPGFRGLVALTAVQALVVVGALVGPYGAFAQAGIFSALALVLALTVSSFFYMRSAGPGGRLAYPVMVIVALGVGLRLTELATPERMPPGFDAYVLGFPGLLVGLVALAAWTHHLSRQRLEAQRKLVQWQAHEQQRLQDEVKRKTRALNAALEQAEHRAREQTRLMAYISHDLRAPLATIMGHARLLRAELGAAPARLGSIERSARYQLALVDDLLEYARGELLPLALDPRPVRLPALIEDIAQYAAALAQRQNNRFLLEVRGALPPAVQLDSKRFQQLLLNLLSNAAKFTRDGQMGLRVTPRPAGSQWKLDVEVWDSGIGIDKKDQRRVFRAFTQADPASAGVGLGLAIARRIVERMGGELRLDSHRHLGTRLSFSVLVAAAAEDDAPAAPSAPAAAPPPAPPASPRRHAQPAPAIAPLPAPLREELEALARDGRWSDLHEWADRLAADPHHGALVKAVRQALENLDFDHIGHLARVTPSE
ncbi:signal transduction histidine kinase [Variovorax sp. TBS-050B]|uniref:sensor histidine kinase n=1 Tax=Variovorax sp. TBS-050B TaxID=2940551 RepID=UPI002473E125|nr:ATP-binding protein [Variovorax sp. TBS-050B]MDH6590472.1 signal transduction histidine kinase [Variovorax sp. TBS-050B]